MTIASLKEKDLLEVEALREIGNPCPVNKDARCNVPHSIPCADVDCRGGMITKRSECG